MFKTGCFTVGRFFLQQCEKTAKSSGNRILIFVSKRQCKSSRTLDGAIIRNSLNSQSAGFGRKPTRHNNTYVQYRYRNVDIEKPFRALSPSNARVHGSTARILLYFFPHFNYEHRWRPFERRCLPSTAIGYYYVTRTDDVRAVPRQCGPPPRYYPRKLF